jgi:urease accessory protein
MRDAVLETDNVQASSLPSNQTARIEARFEQVRGTTQLTKSFHRAPLKIAKAFPQDDGSLHVCTMDCSPGLLSGDRYELDFHLLQNTHVYLTNQSFTRVHPARRAEDISRQMQRIVMEDGATLELFPEPVMLFRDAAVQLETQIEMAPQSTLMMSDITCAGRIARGECFDFRLWQNRIDVRMNGELIYCNRQRLRPQSDNHVRAPGAWESYTHWGNFFIFSKHAGAELLEELREVLITRQESVFSGSSLTTRHGIAVAIMGHHAWELQQLVEELRQLANSRIKTYKKEDVL